MRSSGGLVCQGIIDGTNGTDGYNTVVVPLYRRSASVLTDNNRPSGHLTYTFSTGRLTGASTYFNGWSQTIPTASANTKLYVIMAVARSQSDTDEIAATDWSTPVEYVADGMSSAPVFIYKRAASQPTDKPADGAVYTFATGALTGTLNGWSTNIPATDNNHYPCWVRQAMAVSRGTTDTINADEWSNPATKLVEDGASITKKSETYRYATNNTGVCPAANSADWSTTKPTLQKGYWLFTETTITWSDDSTTVLYTAERNPNDGISGQDIIVDGATVMKYYVGDSNSTHPAEGSNDWKDLSQVTQTKGKWLWSKATTYYRKASSSAGAHDAGYTVTYNVTYIALDGNTPEAARGIESVTEYYKATNSSSAMSAPTSDDGWSTDPNLSDLTNKWGESYKYLWNFEKVTYNKAPLVERTIPQIVAIWTKDGGTGGAGRGIDSIQNYYKVTNSSTAPSKPSTPGTGGWSTTPTAPGKGQYLWNYEVITWINPSGTTETDVQMIGYAGTNGADAQYIYLKGSAFNKDSAGTNVAASEIKVNGGSNLATQSRGLCLVTLNRQTLAVVDSATIYDTYEGTTGKNNLITKLNSLGTNVFVCLVSYDAIGWSDTLISTLQSFGMSDLPYTSANRYPFLFIGYKNLGKGNGITRMNDMEEPAIPVELGVYVANGALSVKDGKDGEDGDDAVMYDIVFDTAWAKADAEGYITARLEGKAYKIVGSVRSPLAGAMIRHGYILNDNDTYADTTTNNDGSFSTGTWFDGDQISGYAKGSNSIFAAIIIDGSVKCVKYVTIANKGDKGDTGRMYYIAGEFPKKAPYSRTSKLCPVVYFGTKWWYLDAASATASDIPSDSSNKWKELQNYGVVLTDAIFVKQFAQFGAAIITGDWLISCHGTIGGVAYGGSVENPDQYNNRAAYTYFDPVYPQGYDPFQLPVTNDEIDRGYNTQWTKITDNFILEAGTYKFRIRCYVNSSDGMHLRLFYGDETGDGYYLQGVTNEEPVTYEIEKTLDSTRNDWNIRAGMNEDGEVGYIVSVEIEPADARFVPNYAVDLRTGRSYQSDAHIKGTITSVGPNTKIVIGDGIMEFFGKFDFPNIVVGVDADGCAILNFYDKSGKFKYGLGPDKIIETLSQAESMKLTYYNVDTGSTDCTALADSDYVAIYLYTYKNQSPASAKCLYKYLAKISANVYGGNYVNNDDAQGRKFNGKIIKQDYSIPLQNSNIYTGGIVMSSSRVQCGMTSYLSNMLSGTSYEELDYRGYNVMKDSDFNVNKDGYVYRFVTKDPYNPTEAFYIDKSYYNEGVGYSGVYADKYHLNLCTDPEYDDKLIDPIYWFNLICINSEGASLGVKTLYINRSKLKRLLQNAGYSL